MKQNINETKRMQQLAGVLKENQESNNPLLVGAKIAGPVMKLISSNADLSQFVNTPEELFGFYEKVFESIMNQVYEKYGDSFNTKAGAAPDEY
jgi:hypothetical protein